MKAQLAGKAIVASNNGMTSEMINEGETGVLFQAGNSAELADKLLKVMNDAELRRQLATQGKESSVRWTSKVLCENMLGLYDQVLKTANFPSPGTIQKPDLADQSHQTAQKSMGRDSAAGLFMFKTNSTFDQKEWHTIANRLPTSYSIPDASFLRVLTETNRFDE